MSMNIVYTHTARQDLREIYEYIAFTLLVPDTARSLTDKIMADIRSLSPKDRGTVLLSWQNKK